MTMSPCNWRGSPSKWLGVASRWAMRFREFGPGATADVLIFLRGSGQAATPARTVIVLAGMRFPETEFRGDMTFVGMPRPAKCWCSSATPGGFRDITAKTDERFTKASARPYTTSRCLCRRLTESFPA